MCPPRDLSETSIESLPTAGLADVKTLILRDVWSLRTFPHVLSLHSVREAQLTYPQHCCAFSHPEKQDREVWLAFKSRVKQDCAAMARTTMPTFMYDAVHFDVAIPTVVPRWLTQTFNDQRGPRSAATWGDNRSGANGHQMWHTSTLDPNQTYTSVVRCGMGFVEQMKQARCSPQPDAFNPCEDVMGLTWLRVIVWAVIVTALLGNLMVVVVSFGTSYRLTVPKFLMCNLAFADLTLGMYLLLLGAIDLHTQGVYFNFSIAWQYEGGCQMAGFLAIFSTCYSVFTLTVITMERWYAIRHAIHLTKRLRLRQAAGILLLGWVFAVFLAALPIIGVSSYSKTSICLPMETTTTVDKLYVSSLLTINAAAFVAICACYFDMYRQVRVDHTVMGSNDANIAKRMALLIFTDFTCLFPIAFFGLTAAFGCPLITVTESKILLVFFFPVNSCANPFLYALFTKQFHKDFVGMMSRCGVCERRIMKYRTVNSHPASLSHSRSTIHNIGIQPTTQTQLRHLQSGGSGVTPNAAANTPIDVNSLAIQLIDSARDSHPVCIGEDINQYSEGDNGYDSTLSPTTPQMSQLTSGDTDTSMSCDVTSERKDSKVTTITNMSPCCSTEALHQVEVNGSGQLTDDSADDGEIVVKNGRIVSWTKPRSGGNREGPEDCLINGTGTDVGRIENCDFNETNVGSALKC